MRLLPSRLLRLDCPREPTPAPQAVAPTAVPTAVKPVEPVTITWFNQFGGDIVNEVMPKMVADFEAQNPDVKVKYELSGGPPGGGDYTEVLMARVSPLVTRPTVAHCGPRRCSSQSRARSLAVDEFMQNAEYAKPGAFRRDRLLPMGWQDLRVDLLGPRDGAVFINKKKFEEKGISKQARPLKQYVITGCCHLLISLRIAGVAALA